jgi:hypothetical protein
MRRAAGPVPVAGGGNDLAVLADSEGRRGDPLHAAFPDVIGVDCDQEPLQTGVIQVQRPGDADPGLGTEVRRIQVGQGRRAADLGDLQPAAEYLGAGEPGDRQAAEGLLDQQGGPVIGRGSQDGVADDHDAGPARRAQR